MIGAREETRREGVVAPSPRRARVPRTAVALLAAAVLLVGLTVAGAGWAFGGDLLRSDDDVRFVLDDPETGAELFSRSLEVGERIELTHTHSVTKRPVLEVFSVDADRVLTLEEMVFDEPGPNLPTGPERFGDRDTTFSHEDGAYRVRHHGFPITTVGLRVGGEDVDHTLTFADGSQVRLLELTRAGGPVELTTR